MMFRSQRGRVGFGLSVDGGDVEVQVGGWGGGGGRQDGWRGGWVNRGLESNEVQGEGLVEPLSCRASELVVAFGRHGMLVDDEGRDERVA